VPDDTRSLTRAIARGDTQAFGVLYERWFDYTYTTARRLTGCDEAFCLDVVQEAMLKTAKRIPTLANEAALGAWLRKVVHHTAIDALRAQQRRHAREHHAQQNDSAQSQTNLSPTELKEQIVWLRERLKELSAHDHRLLLARFSRNRTLAQAGDEIGISGDAAHGRIRRILSRLKRATAKGTKDQP